MTGLFANCVYTMRHTDELDLAYSEGRRGEFTERKKWTTVLKWVRQAKTTGARIPIVFGAAQDDRGLVFYAFLDSIKVEDDERGPTTTYNFSGMAKIQPPMPLSSLTLVNQRRPLSRNFIRPYALCETPGFIDRSE